MLKKWRYITFITIIGLLLIPSSFQSEKAFALEGDTTFFSKSNCEARCWSYTISTNQGIVYNIQYFWSEPGRVTAYTDAGLFLWDYPFKREYITSNKPSIGKDGTLYLSYHNKNDFYKGGLLAIDVKGNLKWKFENKIGVASKPVIGHDGTIYFGDMNDTGYLGPFQSGYVYAVNPDGSLKWKYQTDGDLHTPMVIGSNETLYVNSGKTIYALSSSGNLKWSEGISETNQQGKYRELQVDNNGNIYYIFESSKQAQADLISKNPSGITKWKYPIEGDTNYYLIADEHAILVGPNIIGFDENGNIKWNQARNDGTWFSDYPGIFIANNHVYFITNTESQAFLNAYSLVDGQFKWKTNYSRYVVSLEIHNLIGYATQDNGTIYEVFLSNQRPEDPLTLSIPNVELPSTHAEPVARLHVRQSLPLLKEERDGLFSENKQLKRGEFYRIYGVKGMYYHVGGSYYVKYDPSKMGLYIGRIKVMKPTIMYDPSGTEDRIVQPGEELRVYAYDHQQFQVGGGYYIDNNPSNVSFYVGTVSLEENTILYDSDNGENKQLEKGTQYPVYRIDGNQFYISEHEYILNNRYVHYMKN